MATDQVVTELLKAAEDQEEKICESICDMYLLRFKALHRMEAGQSRAAQLANLESQLRKTKIEMAAKPSPFCDFSHDPTTRVSGSQEHRLSDYHKMEAVKKIGEYAKGWSDTNTRKEILAQTGEESVMGTNDVKYVQQRSLHVLRHGIQTSMARNSDSLVAIGTQKSVVLLELEYPNETIILKHSPVSCTEFLEKDSTKRVILGTFDGTISIWNPLTGKVDPLEKYDKCGVISNIQEHPCKDYVISSSEENWILHDLETRTGIFTKMENEKLRGFDLHPAGDLFAAVLESGNIRLYDLRAPSECIASDWGLQLHNLRFHEDGHSLIHSAGKELIVMDYRTKKVCAKMGIYSCFRAIPMDRSRSLIGCKVTETELGVFKLNCRGKCEFELVGQVPLLSDTLQMCIGNNSVSLMTNHWIHTFQ